MWYNVDFRKLGVLLLPTFLRSPSMIAIVNVFTSYLETLNYDFRINRRGNIERAIHNSQVCYLRKILNDNFDYLRRIRIDPALSKQEMYIYTDAENKPKWLGELYIYPAADYAYNGFDFVVKVPAELREFDEEINATIEYYRLASKKYKIEYETI